MRSHVRKTLAAAACVLGVAGGVAVSAGSFLSSSSAVAGHVSTVSVPGDQGIRPDIVNLGRVTGDSETPPTTANCQQQIKLPCYDPAQLQQAYSLGGIYSRNITGKGTTIALVDPYGSPTIGKDLGTFDSAFGLPSPSLSVIRPDGTVPSYNKHNANMVFWAGETTLDVEYAHAIAPGAKLLLVETPTSGDGFFLDNEVAEDYVVTHHLADVISQSFGGAEQQVGGFGDSVRGAYVNAVQDHVTMLASSGDQGATQPTMGGGTLLDTHRSVSYPATDPLVTAIGGTEMFLDANGDRTSPDIAWNDTYNTAVNRELHGNNGAHATATGGGASVIFSRPAYQKSVWKTVGDMRGIPDISMNAACSDPVLVYESFPGQSAGWDPVCGTSEASPLFAGIVALADQLAGHSLGDINAAIYKLAAEHAKGIVLVTSGNNTVSFKQHGHLYTVRGYKARGGYSRVVGVGTINGQYFIPELARLG
jgi:subtilase family serine protease